MNGGISSRISRRPHSAPDPGGPSVLWPEKTKKSQSRSWTLTGSCGAAWAPSTSTNAPAACALATISLTGLIVPMPLLTAVKATSLGFVRSSASKLSWLRCPSSSNETNSRSASFSWVSICHGMMLEWCSISVVTMVSALPMFLRPHAYATRLMASVALRTMMISRGSDAPMNAAILVRAPS